MRVDDCLLATFVCRRLCSEFVPHILLLPARLLFACVLFCSMFPDLVFYHECLCCALYSIRLSMPNKHMIWMSPQRSTALIDVAVANKPRYKIYSRAKLIRCRRHKHHKLVKSWCPWMMSQNVRLGGLMECLYEKHFKFLHTHLLDHIRTAINVTHTPALLSQNNTSVHYLYNRLDYAVVPRTMSVQKICIPAPCACLCQVLVWVITSGLKLGSVEKKRSITLKNNFRCLTSENEKRAKKSIILLDYGSWHEVVSWPDALHRP